MAAPGETHGPAREEKWTIIQRRSLEIPWYFDAILRKNITCVHVSEWRFFAVNESVAV